MIHANASVLDGSLYFTVSFFMVALSLAGYFIYLFKAGKKIAKASFVILVLAFAAETFAFAARWSYSFKIGISVPPLTDLYDSLVFLSYVILLGFILLRLFYDLDALGFIATLLAASALYFASFFPDTASSVMEQPSPVLRSYWLLYHIITLFMAYGAFACASGLGILFLFKYKEENNRSEKGGSFLRLVPPTDILDEIIYKTVIFGFVFLSAGILIGCVWADSAWGGYWSWDPKETWSLITWLVYALFMHARITKGWTSKKMAWVAVAGFIIVIVCYLGVDLLMPGLHSYATPGSNPAI